MEGTPFGRYRLVELLGRGGMGDVWRAFDTTFDRVVALKVLPANLADDQVFQERFRREARAAAGLDDPHVVPIHDYGEVGGRLYVTMRLIKGSDLQQLLRDGPLSPARAVSIIEQIASALHAAHEVGLIHRDVKPSNILVSGDDFAYLIDFGIARTASEIGLTDTGATIGTWSYMAPERFTTGEVDSRSDVYALACVLHQALTGSVPFPGESLEQQVAGHMFTPPPHPSELRPGIPQGMDRVMETGLAKDPAARFPTAKALAAAARDALTESVSQAATVVAPEWASSNAVLAPPSPAPPPMDWPDQPRDVVREAGSGTASRAILVAGAVLAVVALALGATIWLITKPGKDSQESSPPPTMRGIIVLAIDVSRSMAATDVSPSRLEAVTSGASRFAERLNPGLSLGLITYAGTATVDVAPTTNHEATASALRRMKLADRTATGEGIITSLRSIATLAAALGRPPTRILLISDGKETVPSNPDDPNGAFTAARAAREQGVPVSTIALGTPDGYVAVNGQLQPTPVDDSMSRQIAGIAGGSAYTAATIDELNGAFDQVLEEIG